MKHPGQVAFEAYVAAVGGSTHDSKPIPQWDALSDSVKHGWGCAAQAINDLIAEHTTVAHHIETLRALVTPPANRAVACAATKLDEFEMWLAKAVG